MNPFISFIIPAYQAADCIEPCLKSISALQEKSVEIIVVDDGSDDSKALQEVLRRYPETRYFCQENCGVSAARNTGIEQATGKFITFLDADDCLDVDGYNEILSRIQKEKIPTDFFMFGYFYVEGNKETKKPPCLREGPHGKEDGTDILRHDLLDHQIAKRHCSKYIGGKVYQYIVRRELFSSPALRFPVGVHYAEDLCYCLLLMNTAQRIYVIPLCGYRYFANMGSVSHRLRENYWQELLSVYQIVKAIPGTASQTEQLYYRYVKEAIAHYVTYIPFNNLAKANKKIDPIVEDKRVEEALESISFTNWTIKERIENLLLCQQKVRLLLCFEYCIKMIKCILKKRGRIA